ncbi:hypothetical protein [Neisseria dumasiana]|uniref:hypothetical protein n=1 Tax=Neisseria dumasiana TaxID=1931275 RepID=UPI001FCFCB0F|nr:hypothetical protein [Neisseria dumasiana]UOO83536.1 hypothetical protein LVJ88_07400 [Neisseria dumasiana]
MEVPVMPAPPAVLMVAPVRPAPPENGSVRALLEHAAEFGAYTAELEIQNAGWREWVRGNYQLKVNSSNLKETLKSSETGK